MVGGGGVECTKAETVTGSISLTGQLVRSGSFDFDTHSGTIDITLPANSNASVSVVTIAGQVTNNVSRTRPVAGRFGRGAELTTEVNGGGARLSVRTFKGPVTLRTAK